MSFSKWIRGGEDTPVFTEADVGDTKYSRSGAESAECLRVFLDSGALHFINSGFVWATSPQGWHYWHERHEGDEPLSEEDYAFIRALAEHFESGGGSRYAG